MVVSGVRSLYRGKGKIDEADECLLVIKSSRDPFDPLRSSWKGFIYEVTRPPGTRSRQPRCFGGRPSPFAHSPGMPDPRLGFPSSRPRPAPLRAVGPARSRL